MIITFIMLTITFILVGTPICILLKKHKAKNSSKPDNKSDDIGPLKRKLALNYEYVNETRIKELKQQKIEQDNTIAKKLKLEKSEQARKKQNEKFERSNILQHILALHEENLAKCKIREKTQQRGQGLKL